MSAKRWTFLEALRRRMRGGDMDEMAGAAKAGAEEMHRNLPESLSARPAIEEDRRRKAAIDAMLRDAER